VLAFLTIISYHAPIKKRLSWRSGTGGITMTGNQEEWAFGSANRSGVVFWSDSPINALTGYADYNAANLQEKCRVWHRVGQQMWWTNARQPIMNLGQCMAYRAFRRLSDGGDEQRIEFENLLRDWERYRLGLTTRDAYENLLDRHFHMPGGIEASAVVRRDQEIIRLGLSSPASIKPVLGLMPLFSVGYDGFPRFEEDEQEICEGLLGQFVENELKLQGNLIALPVTTGF